MELEKAPTTPQLEADIALIKGILADETQATKLAFARITDSARHSDRVLYLIKKHAPPKMKR